MLVNLPRGLVQIIRSLLPYMSRFTELETTCIYLPRHHFNLGKGIAEIWRGSYTLLGAPQGWGKKVCWPWGPGVRPGFKNSPGGIPGTPGIDSGAPPIFKNLF